MGQEILDASAAQTKPVVEPDGVTDDLGWKAVSVVAESRGLRSLMRPSSPW